MLSQNIVTFQCYLIAFKYLREIFSLDTKDCGNSNQNFDHLFFQQKTLKVLKEYPFNSIREFAYMTNIPKTTVHRMHTNELHFISWHLKRIRHNLKLSHMVARVELSNGLLSTLKKEKHQNFNYNFTGDKT